MSKAELSKQAPVLSWMMGIDGIRKPGAGMCLGGEVESGWTAVIDKPPPGGVQFHQRVVQRFWHPAAQERSLSSDPKYRCGLVISDAEELSAVQQRKGYV
jgi:hypothetical protein